MKMIELIEKVGDYSIVKNLLYYIKNKCIFLYKKDECLLSLDEYWGVSFYENTINVFTNRSHNTLYDYSGKKIKSYPNINIYYISSENSFLYFDRHDKTTKYNDHIFIDGKLGKHSIIDKRLFFENANKIYSSNLVTYEENIICDLSSLNHLRDFKIVKFINFHKNQLFVVLEGNTVISLDIATGKLLNEFNIQNSFSTSYHLDEKNNRLIILSNTSLYHINLITNKVSLVKDYHDVPQQEQWRFISATLYNSKLYFTGDLGLEYVVATRIGVMDIETGEILWQEQLKKTGGLPNAPQVTQDKLYVLTVNKQLYIFQKEETLS